MSDPMVKEVRLGLVCYGGVSLAIYMHGLTKEIFKLVRAARAFDRALENGDFNPGAYFGADSAAGQPADDDTEVAYFEALKALSDGGNPLTVVVDVIAGTSAGGINGVCLARGLAEGRSLENFRQLWLDEGDMTVLLAGHAHFPLGKATVLEQALASVVDLWRKKRAGLLDGNRMSDLLYKALDGMKTLASTEASLVRPDESLDLFVTATNVNGYETVIPTGAGGYSHTDRSYRQLMRFSYQQESSSAAAASEQDFSDVPALAFAARATASFPGAFPPVSLGSFLSAVDDAADSRPAEPLNEAATQTRIARHFVYGPEYETPGEQWFMDGGVLDNGPFDHVIDAIAAKRADGPTAREIIYLEPDPGPPIPPHPADGHPADGDPDGPTFAQTILASRVTIPWHTPLTSVLGELETMNATIAEVGDLVKVLAPAVLEKLKTAVTVPAALTGQADYNEVTDNSGKVRSAARTLTGELGYGTYCRLRAQTLAESFAMTVAAELGFPADSNRSNFIVAVFCAWTRLSQSWPAGDAAALEAKLGPVDVPFRLRRAELILQAINELFTGSDSARQDDPVTTKARHDDLVAIKSACWDLLCELRAKQQTVASMVRRQAMDLFGPRALRADGWVADPARFAREHEQDLDGLFEACVQAVTEIRVEGTSQKLWKALTDHTSSWGSEARSELLGRYVGFPIWDSVIFPEVALAKLPQLTPIGVHRFSPLDATCLQPVGDQGKLKAEDDGGKLEGVAYHHFAAFFEKDWRENDYLWGRLDGAELIMRLLSRQSRSDLDLTEHLRSALTAILGSEHDQLTEIRSTSQALMTQVENLKAGCMADRPG